MTKYIDWKTVISLILAGVALFFLQKWLTKKVTVARPDGSKETAHYVGNDSLGYM